MVKGFFMGYLLMFLLVAALVLIGRFNASHTRRSAQKLLEQFDETQS
jgi:hypothetical protein